MKITVKTNLPSSDTFRCKRWSPN